MTPYQLKLCLDSYEDKIKADHENDLWIMWHSAALARCRDMPTLRHFLGKEKEVKGVDEHAIMARLKAYSSRYKTEG